MSIKLFVILALLLSVNSFKCQETPRFYSLEKVEEKMDSLEESVGFNKVFYNKYKAACLIALSHYPELKNTSITFQRKNIKTTMAARPSGFQVFKQKGKRHYSIFINDFTTAKIHPDSASFNAQVGVIGHELAHILDYENKSGIKILGMGILYFHKGFKRKTERNTDLIAIRHGLMWQCYDYSVFVYQYSHTSEKYLEFKKKTYLSPDEILNSN